MRGSRASRSRLAPTNRSRWEVRGATDGIVSRHAIAPGKRGAAGTGNKVAPVSALLRPARPCSFDGRMVRNGHGRSGPERCARDRSACGSVGRVRPRPPVARPGAAMKSSPCAMTCSSRPCVLRFKLAGITTPQSDFERVVGRVAVGSRHWASFRVPFFCKGLRWWSGLGSGGVGGPPRVDPCDALLRPVPRRTLAGLSGAHSAPAPGIRLPAKCEAREHSVGSLCAVGSRGKGARDRVFTRTSHGISTRSFPVPYFG
jgi:hypothetical protein